MKDPNLLTENEIIQRLASRLPEENHSVSYEWDTSVKPASVLVPLLRFEKESGQYEWHILYTRRTDRVADHKSQVSFPGGRSDPEDRSPETTALREAFEEIGLRPSDVKLAGRLNKLLTVTNYLITPVVGFIPWPYSFTLQPEEVSRVFSIPISWLADPRNHEFIFRYLPENARVGSPIRVAFFRPYDGETLWGVSAEITLCLLEKLGVLSK